MSTFWKTPERREAANTAMRQRLTKAALNKAARRTRQRTMTTITLSVTKSDKARYQEAADPQSVATWIKSVLETKVNVQSKPKKVIKLSLLCDPCKRRNGL